MHGRIILILDPNIVIFLTEVRGRGSKLSLRCAFFTCKSLLSFMEVETQLTIILFDIGLNSSAMSRPIGFRAISVSRMLLEEYCIF